MKQRRFRSHKGVTLIEVIIDASILVLIATVIIAALLSSLREVTRSSQIAAAAQLANERLETIRNLSYDDLATVNGPIYPPGSLPDDETYTRSKMIFNVHTDIRYIDDPYDGLVNDASPDLNPADYKRVTLTITDQATGKVMTTISTDISSRAAETVGNTGVLLVKVIDAAGQPVEDAAVTVTNASTNPAVAINSTTDLSGQVFIPNLPLTTGYHAIATKSGYSTDSTQPASGSMMNPVNPDATVLLQQVSTVVLTIDHIAKLQFNGTGSGVGAGNGSLVGQKMISNDPQVPKTTISFPLSASYEFDNLEFDSYSITPPDNVFLKTCNPMLPIAVPPSSSATLSCELTLDASEPRISRVSPNQTSAVANISIEIDGANFDNAAFSLALPSQAEIPFVSGLTVSTDSTVLSGQVDFSSLTPGTYNVIYRNLMGKTVTQIAGITIQ